MSDTDGWIEHDGRGMPVAASAKVIVRHRDGGVSSAIEAEAWDDDDVEVSFWGANPSDPSHDIVAYKVVS